MPLYTGCFLYRNRALNEPRLAETDGMPTCRTCRGSVFSSAANTVTNVLTKEYVATVKQLERLHHRSKSGKPIPPWLIEPGHMSQYPVAEVNTCYIYAIIDLKTGKTYMGRTIKNPYVRFVEHRKSGDLLGKAILMDDSKFVVLTLEVLPRYFPCALQSSGIQQHWRVRENSWIHRLNTFQNGYNTRTGWFRLNAQNCVPD